jgi:hypothetical protein
MSVRRRLGIVVEGPSSPAGPGILHLRREPTDSRPRFGIGRFAFQLRAASERLPGVKEVSNRPDAGRGWAGWVGNAVGNRVRTGS